MRNGSARVFLLSPAFCGGKRAQLLLSPGARFELAQRVRAGQATLGEVFSFLSGLYFRGKLAYSRAFVRPPRGMAPEEAILVITTNEGLVRADEPISLERLRRYEEVAIDASEERYRRPLARDAREIARRLGPGQAVLLGSIATGKYVDVLLETLGPRLVFPREFVGRGDMSRGGLMLRCVGEGRELEYVAVAGARRHGVRPPKLAPLRKSGGRRTQAGEGRAASDRSTLPEPNCAPANSPSPPRAPRKPGAPGRGARPSRR